MKILVTGAGGFIGSEIVRVLEESADDVIPVFNLSSAAPEKKYSVDITDETSLDEVLGKIGKIDAVIHSAGLAHQFRSVRDEEFYKVNVVGTRNICRLAGKLGASRFVLISSVAVYGSDYKLSKQPVDETVKCSPLGAYAKSKLESEVAASEICSEIKLPLSIIRPATVIGESDRGNVFRLIRAIDRRRFFWIGEGINRKSLIHRTDVAEICSEVCKRSEELIEVLNCSAESVQMKELVETIERALDKPVPKFSIPAKGALRLGSLMTKIGFGSVNETISKWLAEDVYSADLLKLKYQLVPQIPVVEAIRREVEFYKK